MKTLDQLASISKALANEAVNDWVDQGKKVVGYVCTYVPEEILFAADILPYRITGKGAGDTSLADAYLTRVNCSFARCCLEQGLRGEYDFLEGAVWINGCDHIRRCYDNWNAKIPRPFMHMLPVPHLFSPEGKQWYREEVVKFKDAVEKHFKVEITPEKLSGACKVYNKTRRLLRRLYDLRAGDTPPFTGAEVSTILSAAFVMPRTDYNGLLERLLNEAKAPPGVDREKVRLLVAGSLMDDSEFIENVEDMGAVVVTDALCFGARYFWDLVSENGDPFDALVDRYYMHAPCPRMVGEYETRRDFILNQIERADVKGAILQQIKFCDLHGTDNALLKKDLEKNGVPAIELEREYGPLADAGRVRTRVQAFLEKIGG